MPLCLITVDQNTDRIYSVYQTHMFFDGAGECRAFDRIYSTGFDRANGEIRRRSLGTIVTIDRTA